MLIHAVIIFCQLTLSCRPARCPAPLLPPPLALLPFSPIYHAISLIASLTRFCFASSCLIQPLMPHLQHPPPSSPLLLPSPLSLSLSGSPFAIGATGWILLKLCYARLVLACIFRSQLSSLIKCSLRVVLISLPSCFFPTLIVSFFVCSGSLLDE